MRDGQWVATQPLKGMTMDQIIGMMVGRELTQRFPEDQPAERGDPRSRAPDGEEPTLHSGHHLQPAQGEILGIAGLVGAKRTDIVETLFGIRDRSEGIIKLHGQPVANHNAHEAIRNGFALVTEERRSTGIYSRLDIAFNSLIANMDNYKGSMGLLSDNKMKSDTQWVIDSMRVKTPTQQTQIGSLSGATSRR